MTSPHPASSSPDFAIEVRNLCAGPSGILKNLSHQIPRASFTCILGQNGSGKTTLLQAVSQQIPFAGQIYIQNTLASSIPRTQFARKLAVVPAFTKPDFQFTVEEVVETGRHPHRTPFALLPSPLHPKVQQALALTDLTKLAHQPVTHLSSGEYQRVLIARALAQDTPILLLDEPTAHLDLAHQSEIFKLLQSQSRSHQQTIVCITHDLNHASAFADHLILLHDGQILCAGSPDTVLTPQNLQAAFQISPTIIPCPTTGRPFVLPSSPLLETRAP